MSWFHNVMRGALGSMLLLAAGCNIEWVEGNDGCQGCGCYDDCCYEDGCYSYMECWDNFDCESMYGPGWTCRYDGWCEPSIDCDCDCGADVSCDCDCGAVPECYVDRDCPVVRSPCVSNSCVDGQCVLKPNGNCCTDNSDCRELYGDGWICGAEGMCEAASCRTNSDCSDFADDGMSCGCFDGTCQCFPVVCNIACTPPVGSCSTVEVIGCECVVFHNPDCCDFDEECGLVNDVNCESDDANCISRRSMVCENRRCVEPASECVVDADCPLLKTPCVSNACVEGQCVLQPNGSCCVDDSDCPAEAGFYCTEGVCYGYVASCEEGICQSHVEPMTLQCVVNEDCPSGGACSESICDDGVCVMNPIADCCESDIDCNPMVYADCMAKGGTKCIGAVEAPTQVCRNNRCEPIDVEPECVIASDCPVADDVCMVSDCVEGVCSMHKKDGCCNSASDCAQPDNDSGLVSICYEHRCALMVAPECVSANDCTASDACNNVACEAGRCVETPASDCCQIDDDCPQPDDIDQMMLCRDHRCALFQRVAK